MVRGIGITRWLVVAQLVDVDGARLFGDLLQNRARKDLRPKDRGYTLLLDLIDQGSNLFGGRFGKIRGLNRADDCHSVTRCEISIRVVICQEFTVFLRDRLDCSSNSLVEAIKEIGVAREVFLKIVRAVGNAFG